MKLEIQTSKSVHFEVTEKLLQYTRKKATALERYIPKSARESAHIEIRLKQVKPGEFIKSTCDITLQLPKDVLHTQETTQHMFTAVDIATANLRNQISDYKSKHLPIRLRNRIAKKFGTSSGTEL